MHITKQALVVKMPFINFPNRFCFFVHQAIIYEGQDKNPEMCRVLLTHEIMCRWDTHVHRRSQITPPSLLHNHALEPECRLTFPSPAGWLWGLYFGFALVLARLRASGSSVSLTGLSFLLSRSRLPLQTHSCGALSESAVVKSYLKGRDRLALLKNGWKVTSLFFHSSYVSV